MIQLHKMRLMSYELYAEKTGEVLDRNRVMRQIRDGTRLQNNNWLLNLQIKHNINLVVLKKESSI